MAIVQGLCDSFKFEVFRGTHDFLNNRFRLALYTRGADLSPATEFYSSANEVSGQGYAAGGVLLDSTARLVGSTAVVDFADVVFTNARFTTAGGLIYNTDSSNAAVAVLSFGLDKVFNNEDFTIQFPSTDAATAIIRFS